jgi:hypothetical protein
MGKYTDSIFSIVINKLTKEESLDEDLTSSVRDYLNGIEPYFANSDRTDPAEMDSIADILVKRIRSQQKIKELEINIKHHAQESEISRKERDKAYKTQSLLTSLSYQGDALRADKEMQEHDRQLYVLDEDLKEEKSTLESYDGELKKFISIAVSKIDAENFFMREFLDPAMALKMDKTNINAKKEEVIEQYTEMIKKGFSDWNTDTNIFAQAIGYEGNTNGKSLLKIRTELFSKHAKKRANEQSELKIEALIASFGKEWQDFEINDPKLAKEIKERLMLTLQKEVYDQYKTVISADAFPKFSTVITTDKMLEEISLAMFLTQQVKKVMDDFNTENPGNKMVIPFAALNVNEKMTRIKTLSKKTKDNFDFESGIKNTLFERSPTQALTESNDLEFYYTSYVTKKHQERGVTWIFNQAVSLGKSARSTVRFTYKFIKTASVEAIIFRIVQMLANAINAPFIKLMDQMKDVINKEASFVEKTLKLLACIVFVGGTIAGVVLLSPNIISLTLILSTVQFPMGLLMAYLCVSAISGIGMLAMNTVGVVYRIYERATYGYANHFKYQVKDELRNTFSKDTKFLKELENIARRIGTELDSCNGEINKLVEKIDRDLEQGIDTDASNNRLNAFLKKREILEKAWDTLRSPPDNHASWKPAIAKIINEMNAYLDLFSSTAYLDACLASGAGISFKDFNDLRQKNKQSAAPTLSSDLEAQPPAYTREPSPEEIDKPDPESSAEKDLVGKLASKTVIHAGKHNKAQVSSTQEPTGPTNKPTLK